MLPTVAQHRAEKTRKGRATSHSSHQEQNDARECHTPGRHAVAVSGALDEVLDLNIVTALWAEGWQRNRDATAGTRTKFVLTHTTIIM